MTNQLSTDVLHAMILGGAAANASILEITSTLTRMAKKPVNSIQIATEIGVLIGLGEIEFLAPVNPDQEYTVRPLRLKDRE